MLCSKNFSAITAAPESSTVLVLFKCCSQSWAERNPQAPLQPQYRELSFPYGQYDKLFEQIDTDHGNWITLPEWQAFLKNTKTEKGAEGQKWMATVLHKMSQNLKTLYHT